LVKSIIAVKKWSEVQGDVRFVMDTVSFTDITLKLRAELINIIYDRTTTPIVKRVFETGAFLSNFRGNMSVLFNR
jgi:hypothetical protein